MNFKLIEHVDETRGIVQEYMWDAIDELNNASLQEYIEWFKDNLTAYSEDIEEAVTDAYIEACDYGMIKGVEKTRITSELKEYIESHTDLIDDTDEMMRQCPGHLQHELKIVLSKLDESLTEAVLEEAVRPDLKRFIEQHAELLDENNIEELYKQCPRELKIPLVRMLNAASLGDDTDIIKRATYLEDSYEDEELIDLALSVTHHVNDVFDAFDYIMNNWNEFFTNDVLTEELLTEDMNKDSLGNILTPQQQAYFSESKVIDDNGNLLVCYHGTNVELPIDTLDINKSAYATKMILLSDSKDFANQFANRYSSGQIFECYVNITKPFIFDANNSLFNRIEFNNDIVGIDYIASYATQKGFDGAIVKNVKEYDGTHTVTDIIVFDNSQIKLTTNKNPTATSNMNS